MKLPRRRFRESALCLLASCAGLSFAPAVVADDHPAAKRPAEETRWVDVRTLALEGQGWKDTKGPFDRFPARAEGTVRKPVWGLSRDSAGLCVRFKSDAPKIEARWTLLSSGLALPHMPATGVSGLDLYSKDETGRWRWLGAGRPEKFPTNTATIAGGLNPKRTREFMLYLPLYNGVTSVELGVPAASTIEPADPRPEDRRKPVVFYGTSITQGGCASRPGMAHVAIVGRLLDRPTINLGFSGSGTMDNSVSDLLAELDAAAYVIDCVANMTAEQVAERTQPLVARIRKDRPNTPILLVEDQTYANTPLLPNAAAFHAAKRKGLKAAYERIKAAGDRNVFYLSGDHLMGEDGEGTVDGVHPTDLGFLRMAEGFAAALRPILESGDR
ncbi:MAG: SGNH/GDSL hydrolase family protein [Isosphaeraceae bacterium]